MKYFRLTTILKKKGTDQIVAEAKGYAMGESVESLQEVEEIRKQIDLTYEIYDVQHFYEECSKEEYDDYHDRHMSFEDLKNKIVQ